MYRKTFTYEGKRYDITAKTQEQLYEKIARKKIELEQGTTISKNMLVKEWCAEWMSTYKEPAVSPGRFKMLESFCRSTIVPALGNIQLKDVKSTHVQKMLNNKAKTCKESSLKQLKAVCSDMFDKAFENGLILKNPVTSAVVPKSGKSNNRRSLTPLEQRYFLRAADKCKHGLFFKIIYYCGLRPGEVAALQWCDFDLKNKILKVTKAVKPRGGIGEPKSSAGIRQVPIPDSLAASLKPADNPFDFLFLTQQVGFASETVRSNWWKEIMKQMNIEAGCKVVKGELVPPYPIADDLVPYCLRHTYCTNLQAAGVPINVARELMGHSDIGITSKIYTHSSTESFNNAAELINQLNNKRENVGVGVGAGV